MTLNTHTNFRFFLLFLGFIFSTFTLFQCGKSNSNHQSLQPRTEEEIVRILDNIPLTDYNGYIKVIKDSAHAPIDIQKMSAYLLGSGWKQSPDNFSILLHKIDSAYGNNDTTHFYTLIYKGHNYLRVNNYDSSAFYMEKGLALATSIKDSSLISFSYQGMGAVSIGRSKVIEAMTLMYKAIDYLPKGHDENLCDLMSDVSGAYTRQRNFLKAKQAMYKSLKLAETHGKDSATIALYATHLASAYVDTKEPDSILWAVEKANKIAQKLPDSSLYTLIYYYMGVGHKFKKEYQKGLDYSILALKLSQRLQNNWLSSRINTNIADCYLQMGNIAKAKELYTSTFETQKTKVGIKINTAICDSLVVANLTEIGNYELRNYFTRTRTFVDSTFSAQRINALEEMNVRYETAEKENKIKELALEKRGLQIRMLIIALIFILLLLVSIGVIYRNRQERLLLEKDNKLLAINKQLQELAISEKEKEIESNKELLLRFNESIISKNKLIEEMESKITTLLENTAGEVSDELDKSKVALNAMKILTDNDWKTYLNYFQKAKPGFVEQVNNQFPDLTQGELRLFLLMNFGFNRKEIADILGISTEGVRKNQYRLRKKIALSDEHNMEAFIQSF